MEIAVKQAFSAIGWVGIEPLPKRKLSASRPPHCGGQGMIGTVLIAFAGEPLTILELMAR
jgi:hypothetical protein